MTPEELKEGCLYRILGLPQVGPVFYLGKISFERNYNKEYLHKFYPVDKTKSIHFFSNDEVKDYIRNI